MQRQITYLCLSAIILAGAYAQGYAAGQKKIDQYVLVDVYGNDAPLADHLDHDYTVVAFLGVECPLAKLYSTRIDSLQKKYEASKVGFLGVISNQQDSLTDISAFVNRQKLGYTVLKDLRANLADRLGATRTPEVVVIDRQDEIVYQGRIDDQYSIGTVRDEPQNTELVDALDALISGQPVATKRTQPIGCIIGRPRKTDASSDITYSNQIARILQKHCIECHRDGEIAPFALNDYDEVVGWSGMIAEVIKDRRMPPWHADPKVGHYQGERLMTAEEKETIYKWVEAGAPEGDRSELPEPLEFVTDWRLPKEPDVVIPMRSQPYDVPAEGVIEYQYFVADPGFTEDRWIQAADVIPGARSVVHHVIVFVSPPVDRATRGLGWLTAYVPGQSSMQLPEHQARLIPAGSKLIFQMHYTPVGRVEQDLTKIGLVFADPEKVEEEVVTLFAANGKFEIPPFDRNYRVDASINDFPAQGKLLGMGPHMHVRGKSFEFIGKFSGGKEKTLLNVPQYDFNWQHNYRLMEPISTESGFEVKCVAHYDNSKHNPANPDPSATVGWGDQTFEEMMIAFFEVAVPRGTDINVKTTSDRLLGKRTRKAERTAADFMERYDSNKDGELTKSEMPDSFTVFAFARYDQNGDRKLTYEELFESLLRKNKS